MLLREVEADVRIVPKASDDFFPFSGIYIPPFGIVVIMNDNCFNSVCSRRKDKHAHCSHKQAYFFPFEVTASRVALHTPSIKYDQRLAHALLTSAS